MNNRYEVLHELGRGGTSVVCAARDTLMCREVALKVLLEDTDSTAIKRMLREAQALSELRHPNIVSIYALYVDDLENKLTLVMDLVEGISLGEMIKRDGPLPETKAIELFKQICEGLSFAHTNKIIHRDLKPSNILVTTDGVAQIVDFGLAKFSPESGKELQSLTQTGHIFGTPAYMSPEQLSGCADERSDIYSFGCLMYQTLAGKVPFEGESALEIAAKSLSETAERIPGISSKLQSIIMQAMHRDVTQRYQSCDQIIQDLNAKHNARTKNKRRTTYGAAGSRRQFGLTAAALAAVAVSSTCLYLNIAPPAAHPKLKEIEWYQFVNTINPDLQRPHELKTASIPGWTKFENMADSAPITDSRKYMTYLYLSERLLHRRHDDVADVGPIVLKAIAVIQERKKQHLVIQGAHEARAYIAHAQYLRRMGAPREEQIAEFRKAMAEPSGWHGEAGSQLFSVYLAMGDVDRAIKLLEIMRPNTADFDWICEHAQLEQNPEDGYPTEISVQTAVKVAADLEKTGFPKHAAALRHQATLVGLPELITKRFWIIPKSRRE